MTAANTSEHFTFRVGHVDDVDAIAANNIAMAKETEDLELHAETVRKGVLAVLSGTAHATYFLLEQHTDTPQAQIVAQLMITYEWSDWRNGVVWWIQSVYVPEHFRQQGHFKSLYKHVRQEAQKAGAAGLRLYADVGNERAHTAYERLGMTSHYKVYEEMFTGY